MFLSGQPSSRVCLVGCATLTTMARSNVLAALLASALSSAALATGPPAAAPADPSAQLAPLVAVRPGGLVRWAGETTDLCVFGDERYAPVWTACFFPIDLFAAPGARIEVGRLRAGVVERRTVEVAAYPYPTQEVTITDQGKVDLSPADAARVERDQAKTNGLCEGRSARRFSLPLGAPLAKLPTSGRFGDRRLFNGQPRSPHTGADFPASTGTPVLAAADGTVVLAEEQFFPGNAVVVDHGDGLFTMSFHLSRISVAVGQQVQRGDVLGAVGATGRVSGPHLHFGARWHGARIDPELLLGRASPSEL
jgi:murein DD-endopeptidase MepM/ murein hydrolase activator NlpD